MNISQEMWSVLSKVKLLPEQVLGENKVILVDASPVYEYVDGNKTNKVVGTKYTVACPKRNYEHCKVKVPDMTPILTTEDIHSCEDPIYVTFEGFQGTIYGRDILQLSCKAQKMCIIS